MKGNSPKKMWKKLRKWLESIRAPILYLTTIKQATAGDENTLPVETYKLVLTRSSFEVLKYRYSSTPSDNPFVVLKLSDGSYFSVNVNAIRHMNAIPVNNETELAELKDSSIYKRDSWLGMKGDE